MAENFANNARSVLTGRIVPGQTTLTVRNSTAFPTPNFRIAVNSEYMLVTGVSGKTFTVTRGIEGTTEAQHAAGADVVHVITVGGLSQFINDAIATGGVGPGSSLVSLQAEVDTNEANIALNTANITDLFARTTVDETRINDLETDILRVDTLEDKFNNHIPIANDQAVVLRGSQSTDYVIEVQPDKLGFFSTTPAPLGEVDDEATDAATTMALANNIRALLLGYGLVKEVGAPNPSPGPTPPAPPPASGGSCTITITGAPSSIANNQTLSYTVGGGNATAYQTWLLYASSTPGSTGSGSVQPQNSAVSGSPSGTNLPYTINISNIPAGNYYIWAKDNNGAGCQDSWIAQPITITGAASPPPSAPAGTVPAAITGMATAAAVSKYTTGSTQNPNYTPNGSGDYIHQIFSGQYDAENQSAFVSESMWNLAFVGQDVTQPVIANQYRSRVGLGVESAAGAVSFKLQARLPTAAAIEAYRVNPPSSVVLYPNCAAGMRLGGTSGWPSQQGGVRQPGPPIQFKNILSHWIGAKGWSLLPLSGSALGTGWVAHDMRVCSEGRQTTSYNDSLTILLGEVLVTRLHLPADRYLGEFDTSGYYRGEHVIWGQPFKLYIQQGATNTCLIQLRTTLGLPNHFPMHEIWRFLTETTYAEVGHTVGHRMPGQGVNDPMVNPNSWYHQCATGIEMEADSYDLSVDTYYDRINEDL